MDEKDIIKVNVAQESNVIVKRYAHDIENFKTNAKADFNSIKGNISSMGMHWKGDIYDEFKRSMDTQLNQMQKCLNNFDSLVTKLNVISAKLAEAIADIKKSTGK